MVGGLSVPLLGLVDASIVGRFDDPNALGAVALGAWLFDLIYWSFGFLRMGTTGLSAQAFGRGDDIELKATLARPLIAALFLGTTICLLAPWLGPPALSLLSDGSSALSPTAVDYLLSRVWGGPAVLVNYALLGWLLGTQHAKSALTLQVGINALNIGLSLWWGPLYGVSGVGAASAVSQWVIACFSLMWVWGWVAPSISLQALKSQLKSKAPWRSLWALNRDLFIRTALLLSVFGALNATGARLGALILSANTILLHLQTLQAFALDGFAHGVEVLVGEAIGRRDRALFERSVKAAGALTLGTSVLIALIYALASEHIVDLITAHEQVASTASLFMIWAILSPLLSAPCFLLDGVMIGATSGVAMRRGMILSAVVFVLSMLSGVSIWGNHGLWLSLMIFMVVRALTLAPEVKRLYSNLPARP